MTDKEPHNKDGSGSSPGVRLNNESDGVRRDNAISAIAEDWQSLPLAITEMKMHSPSTMRVWQAVARRMGKNNTVLPKGIEAVYWDDGDWWQLSENVEVKSLFIDEEQNTECFLLRIAPNGVVEPHFHDGFNDECIVVEGVIIVGDVRFNVGDFHVARKGSVHPALHSDSGGILFVRSQRVTEITERVGVNN